MARAVILADADNTLWDTDALFATAQSQLLEAVEQIAGVRAAVPEDQRLGWLRSYDQAIAVLDHRHLRYPPAFLVRSLAMALTGASPAQASAAVVRGVSAGKLAESCVDAIVQGFSTSLSSTPDLLPGVREGLEEAAQLDFEVWILSEGSADRQRSRIVSHGLEDLVRGIAEATKNAEQFARQRRRFAPQPIYVIGDQPDRDIAPAHEAGCCTVLVPSRFKPEWHTGIPSVADQVEETFDRAVKWVDWDLSGNSSTASERANVG